MVRHGSLFSGIGGFDLAAQWMGWENVFQVEIDSFCQKVLAKNFPNVKRYGDIKEFNGEEYRGTIDVLSGGFPCQPFSVAGKRKGKNDVRFLWPEMFRVADQIRPTVIVAENVSGSWKLVDEICSNMESIGYETEPIGIEASCVGANHLRDRYWFIAYSKSFVGSRGMEYRHSHQKERWNKSQEIGQENRNGFKMAPLLDRGVPERRWNNSGPKLARRVHGLSPTVDRVESIGNAIVPQVAYEIFKAIDLILPPPNSNINKHL